jgi:hypothetical protein
VRAEAVVKAGTLQAVAVGHFYRIDARAVQRPGNLAHIVERVLMANGVHPVAQGHV